MWNLFGKPSMEQQLLTAAQRLHEQGVKQYTLMTLYREVGTRPPDDSAVHKLVTNNYLREVSENAFQLTAKGEREKRFRT